MKTLIVYATKYGATEKCANIISEKLSGEVELCNLQKERNIDLSQCDKVIIGSSIYMGKAQKEVRQFCIENLNTLLEKKVGLFLCGMLKNNAQESMAASFPSELLKQAVEKDFFGGEFKFKKLNAVEKMMVKMVSKSNSTDNSLPALDMNNDMSTLDYEIVDKFIRSMDNA